MKPFFRPNPLAILLLAVLLLAAQCGATPPPTGTPAGGETPSLAPVSLAAGERLRVVATTTILADIVRNVGGERIALTTLLPGGVDPHTFEPTPRDLATVAGAHVLFANGFGLETFLARMLQNAGANVPVVEVSAGVTPRRLAPGEGDADEAGAVDPHTWTSPANAIRFVDNIAATLSALDPAHAGEYAANARSYRRQLEELDAWIRAQIESIPPENRALVTDHAVFGYYADRYGLRQVGAIIPSFSAAAEPSAGEIAALEATMAQYGVKAVFVGNSVNPALAQRVADDTGARLVRLYTGSLGEPGSGAETYLDYLRYNTVAIANALR